jgi:hypothetical protein
MNKAVSPEQLDLTPRAEALLARAPHIDPQSPALKESLRVVDRIMESTASVKSILAQAGPSSDDDFDWANSPSVVLQEQPATAIYHNPDGQLVIRQRASWCDESDFFVIVSPENCNVFMDAFAARVRQG